jgi:CheY-like chemotaxis protein
LSDKQMFCAGHGEPATVRTRLANLHTGGRPDRKRPRSPQRKRDVRILLVEDNPGDVALVERALRTWNTPTKLSVVASGEVALDHLRRTRPLPSLALLDLNLPGRGGYEVLAEIKLDPELRSLPVIVLSGSTDPAEAQRSHGAFADAFIQKTDDFTQFAAAMHALEDLCIKSLKEP